MTRKTVRFTQMTSFANAGKAHALARAKRVSSVREAQRNISLKETKEESYGLFHVLMVPHGSYMPRPVTVAMGAGLGAIDRGGSEQPCDYSLFLQSLKTVSILPVFMGSYSMSLSIASFTLNVTPRRESECLSQFCRVIRSAQFLSRVATRTNQRGCGAEHARQAPIDVRV